MLASFFSVKFICNIILIPKKEIGIFGAIFGTFLCNVIAFIISFIVLNKSLKLKFGLKKFIFKPIIATIVMTGLFTFLYKKVKWIKFTKIAVIVDLSIGLIVYILLIFTLKIISKEEIKLLKRV